MFPVDPIEMHHFSKPIVHEQVVAPREKMSWEIPLRDPITKHFATMSEEELDQDWKLGDFFGTTWIVNLPSATERLEKITEELHQIGMKKFKVFKAIDGRQELDRSIWIKFKENRDHFDVSTEEGRQALDRLHQAEAGCYMSHFKLIQHTKKAFDSALKELARAQAEHRKSAIKMAQKKVRRYSRILILEDDAGFGIVDETGYNVSKKGIGRILREALLALPDDWSIFYLMVGAVEPVEEITPHLRKMKKSWSTVAYALNYPMYGPLLDHLKKIEDPNVNEICTIDHEMASIHHLHKVYAIFPSIAYNQGVPSIISRHHTCRLIQGQPVWPEREYH